MNSNTSTDFNIEGYCKNTYMSDFKLLMKI